MFVQGDIGDNALTTSLLQQHQPKAVVHFAAESHVDRSIRCPDDFIQTNVVGTFNLLEEVKSYWEGLDAIRQAGFRFLNVSTDEVYGSLTLEEPAFTERHPYAPNSPYSASKAAADHMVRAYHHTYGLPVLTTNCSNNYGPCQFPEKLIPLTLLNALNGRQIPVYGDGKNRRDWLYVGDHCAAIRTVLEQGEPGEVYNIGGNEEKTNIDLVRQLCRLLDELKPRADGHSYAALISFVADRPDHDLRYAIDARKITGKTGWKPQETFASGMRKTVNWYLQHNEWVEHVFSGAYRNWIEENYRDRT